MEIGGRSVAAGERVAIDLPVGHLVDHNPLHLRIHVLRGRRPGPTLFVSAGLHGDELNGIEIARRLVGQKLRGLRGTLIVVPVLNLTGFIRRSRYLPDRRDLNRLFPGSQNGSLGARLAWHFVHEVVNRANYGIDLHTGATGRTNLPQLRAAFELKETAELARAFRAPVVIRSDIREGSLRSVTQERGIPLLLYEAGEADRLDLAAVRFGERGVLSVMRHLGMLPRSTGETRTTQLNWAESSRWVRAPSGGLVRSAIGLGAAVEEGQVLGWIGDPLGSGQVEICSPGEGIVIGRITRALADAGDALFHLAQSRAAAERAAAHIASQGEAIREESEISPWADPLSD